MNVLSIRYTTQCRSIRDLHTQSKSMYGRVSARVAEQGSVFEGTMDWYVDVDILKGTLLPFIREVYPDGHKLMQDNNQVCFCVC